MKNYILTTFLFLALVTAPVFASEQTGTISTGVETGIEGMVVTPPTATPAAGTYVGAQTISLTGGAGTVSIHYTTDGSTPACTSGAIYTTPITVSSSQTIKAVSCYTQSITSPVASFVYTISSGGGGGGGGGGGSAPLPDDADFNDDGKVDIFDLNILSTNWGSTSATHATGDANHDSVVDIIDLNILSTQWTG